MARRPSDTDARYIASPECRYWPGKGPNGEDVVMMTDKAYPDTILAPEFLERCLEDELVKVVPKPKGESNAPEETAPVVESTEG